MWIGLGLHLDMSVREGPGYLSTPLNFLTAWMSPLLTFLSFGRREAGLAQNAPQIRSFDACANRTLRELFGAWKRSAGGFEAESTDQQR
jgi:hypothetical protein